MVVSTTITLVGKVEGKKEEKTGQWSWSWSGAWAFGTHHNDSGGLPFRYQWETTVDPHATVIPSLQPPPEETAVEEDGSDSNEEEDDKKEEATAGPPKDPEAKAASAPTAVAKAEHASLKEEKGESKGKMDDAAATDTTAPTPMEVDSTEKVSSPTSADKKVDSSVAVRKEPPVGPAKLSASEPGSKATSATSTTTAEPKVKEEKAVATLADCVKGEPSSSAKTGEADRASLSSVTDKVTPDGPTFGDDGFVEASTRHDCVPSGRWKGSFQAAMGRKGQQRQLVEETFCIFLNAEPPSDAKVQFDGNEPGQPPAAPLPAKHIYIRGAGENQFGTFELIGSLSLETNVLRLQRLYIRIPAPPSPPRRGRRSTRPSDETAAARSTRKRQLSWKRKAALDGGDDQRVPKRQKRRRTESEAGSGVYVNDTATLVPMDTSTQETAGVTTRAPAAAPTSASMATSQPKAVKKAAITRTAALQQAAASPHGAVVRLPLEGDPALARWRSAHYYHYNPVPKDAMSGSGGGNCNSTTPKSVIYEGELYNRARDGRGICAYNSDMLYEGEWRQDKEHGFGSLWTADRKRIIYQGEWERGRMHGQGKYYYYNDEAMQRKRRIQSRYEGEFRENLRHGQGTYVLPDGSTYVGQWRDGTMTGRGVFTWPDGSVFDGEWKDNKRNGYGLLKASDGFAYEGAWIQNAMEGRGSATYPDGQEYHGMFSSGRREGRGTIKFPNGAIYEGRFRDDAVDGQGTMKIRKAVLIAREEDEDTVADGTSDFMIPISFQSDMGHIHRKAGFTIGGI